MRLNTKSTDRPGELNPGSSDRPSRSVRTVSQSPEPPRQVDSGYVVNVKFTAVVNSIRRSYFFTYSRSFSVQIYNLWSWQIFRGVDADIFIMKIHVERPAASELKHYAGLKRISLRWWLIKNCVRHWQYATEWACPCVSTSRITQCGLRIFLASIVYRNRTGTKVLSYTIP